MPSQHPPAAAADRAAPLSFEDAQRLSARLRDELGRAIIGQHAVVQEILTAFFAGGHCLLRGVPGLAKTLLIKTLAQAVHLRFNRIQFTPGGAPHSCVDDRRSGAGDHAGRRRGRHRRDAAPGARHPGGVERHRLRAAARARQPPGRPSRTRLAAIRRHRLDDVLLVVVRIAALAAAVGALAGPLLLTPGRRAAWNGRIARAIVVDRSTDGGPDAAALRLIPPAFLTETFEAADARDGIARAVAWLDAARPARQEVVVVSPFALDSIARSDLSHVPPGVGIRLVRSGQLPASRSLEATPVLHADPGSPAVHRRDRTIELNGAATSVRESGGSPVTVPVEIVAAADEKRAAETALAAVLSQRVFAPAPDRQARIVFAASSADLPASPRSAKLAPWIADAIARLTIDEELQAAGPTSEAGDAAKPWFTASTDGARLVVTTTVRAVFATHTILQKTGYIAIGDGEARRTIPVVVTPDALPAATMMAPGRDLVFAAGNPRVTFEARATDDFGLRALTLQFTRVSGTGEQYEFDEGEIPLAIAREDGRAWRGSASRSLAELNLKEGDTFVYRAVATDSRPGNRRSPVSRSPCRRRSTSPSCPRF